MVACPSQLPLVAGINVEPSNLISIQKVTTTAVCERDDGVLLLDLMVEGVNLLDQTKKQGLPKKYDLERIRLVHSK